MPTHTINIEGIKLYAYHGCLEEEAKVGGNYIVDVYITTDFTEAAKTDDLSKTIDYCAVYEITKAEMGQEIGIGLAQRQEILTGDSIISIG